MVQMNEGTRKAVYERVVETVTYSQNKTAVADGGDR